jgi:ADP-ribose pyrophosphatase YjhB (NUDIX family)
MTIHTDLKLLPPEEHMPADSFCVEKADGQIYYAYRYKHPAIAATVVLRDPELKRYLLVRRGRGYFEGYLSFLGGFLEAGAENIEQAISREILEEVGISIEPERFQLVDVRSDVDRDPREHVVDIGYYAEADCSQACLTDEVTEVYFAKASEIETIQLAFDHNLLWQHVNQLYGHI